MCRHLLIFSLLLPLLALAGPIEDRKTALRLNAVAVGDVDALMRDYADGAWMEWVGGPLDGRYSGKAAIREVWQKWLAANDGKPRTARFAPIAQHANPKGVTIETAAEYAGKNTVTVRHVLVWREGELTAEVWQIAPALKVSD